MAATTDGATISPRTDIDIEAYKGQLLELKRSAETTIAEMADQDADGLDTTGPDRDDNHPEDQGTEMQLREQDAALVENENNILSRIERALQKIEEGTYGLSDRSGKPIPKERLDVLPYATLTADEQDF